MLKIIKELMEHKKFSIMQNPEYWENDAGVALESIVKYVNKELPNLLDTKIRCGFYNLPNYKYILEYNDLIGMDIKTGFYLDLTDEEVEKKGINCSNGLMWGVLDIEPCLSIYLKITYCYKLRPEKRITLYYVFSGSEYNSQLHYICGEGSIRHRYKNGHTNFYTLLIYLLVNSIEIKTPEDFNKLDPVIQCPFQHLSNKKMLGLGLMEVSNLIKEKPDEERLLELARHGDDILSSPLEKIVNVTEKVIYELISKEASDQIDAMKKADMEEQEKLKAYQDKLRRERLENTRRLQRHFSTGF